MNVRKAVASDIGATASLLGLAFADYPWTRWCIDADDHVERITQLQRISLEVLGLPHGQVWLGETDEQVISVAVWSDARTDIDRALFTELAMRSTPWHGDRLNAAIAAESGGFDRPNTAHLFLETMGTHPDHRRQGLGARVLQPGLELADRSRMPCGLETSTEGNVEFYRTVGFEIADHRYVMHNGERGPEIWSMWREPRLVTA